MAFTDVIYERTWHANDSENLRSRMGNHARRLGEIAPGRQRNHRRAHRLRSLLASADSQDAAQSPGEKGGAGLPQGGPGLSLPPAGGREGLCGRGDKPRSEEHTSELQSL